MTSTVTRHGKSWDDRRGVRDDDFGNHFLRVFYPEVFLVSFSRVSCWHDSVIIEKPFKLWNFSLRLFFFFFKIKGEIVRFSEGGSRGRAENERNGISHTGHSAGHIFICFVSPPPRTHAHAHVYTLLQKLHHLSGRVACATDNCSRNVVNHLVPIKLTCIIITIIITGKTRVRHARIYTYTHIMIYHIQNIIQMYILHYYTCVRGVPVCVRARAETCAWRDAVCHATKTTVLSLARIDDGFIRSRPRVGGTFSTSDPVTFRVRTASSRPTKYCSIQCITYMCTSAFCGLSAAQSWSRV